jgi:hypothetical protein
MRRRDPRVRGLNRCCWMGRRSDGAAEGCRFLKLVNDLRELFDFGLQRAHAPVLIRDFRQ